MSNVTFAAYGLPSGTCGSFAKDLECNAGDQRANVSQLCLGKHSCTVPVSNTFAGQDPCHGNQQKTMAVQVQCHGSGPAPDPPPATPGTLFVATPDPVVDLLFFAGPTMHDMLRQYTALTGRMSMPPKWALGLWYVLLMLLLAGLKRPTTD